MAKGVYVGVYQEGGVTPQQITTDNAFLNYFSKTYSGIAFTWNSTDVGYTSANKSDNSTATTTFTALKAVDISFDYFVSSESGYDKFTLTVGGTTVANAISGEKSGSWSGSLAANATIVLKYVKDGSASNGSDNCGIKNIIITAELPEGTFARRVTSMYVGIDNIARKVKKAYVGIGGLAMPFWSFAGKLTKLTSVSYQGSDARYQLAGTTVGNCAMFGGGYSWNSPMYTDYVACFSPTLTRTTTSLSVGRYGLGATTVGNYAVFAGGYTGYGNRNNKAVDAFDASGTRSAVADLTQTDTSWQGTTIGNYATFIRLLPGGSSCTLEAYDASLVKTTGLSALPWNIYGGISGTNINKNLAIFGAVRDYYYHNEMHYFTYDSSLTFLEVSGPGLGYFDCGTASIGGHAVFLGGKYRDYTDNGYWDEETGEYVEGDEEIDYDSETDEVIAVDSSITFKSLTSATQARYGAKGITIDGQYALFGGGGYCSWSDYDGYYSDVSQDTLDVYNSQLTKVVDDSLPRFLYARQDHAVTTVGDYTIFSGGAEYGIDDDYSGSYTGWAGDGCPEIYKLI